MGRCRDGPVISPPTPPLLALLGSPELRNRLRAAIHAGAAFQIIGPVTFARDWQELVELAEHHIGSPAVVDPCFPSAGSSFPRGLRGAARLLRERSFPAPLICYAQSDFPGAGTVGGGPVGPRPKRPEDSDIPFEAVLWPGTNDRLEAIESAVLRAIDAGRVHRLVDDIGRRASREARRIIARVLAKAVGPCTVPELAADLGLSRRSLQRRCAVFRGLPPKKLISLGRIFTVERLAAWSSQPSGGVAFALGFSDCANYRRLVRGMLGAPPSVIRKRGGADYVARVIVRAAGHPPQ